MTDVIDDGVRWLAELPMLATLTVIVVGIVGPTLLAVHLLRRRVSHDAMRRHQDVAGFIFSAVGAMYGILLAFTVVLAFEHYHETEAATWAEAGAHHGMLDLLEMSSDPRAAEAKQAIDQYTQLVVSTELSPTSYSGRSGPAEESFRDIWLVAPQVEMPSNTATNQLLRELGAADAARTERLRGAQGAIQTTLWIVLALGGFATVGFGLLFSIESYTPHLIVMGGLSLVIALILFVTVELNFPFVGADAVGADAFLTLVERGPH